MKSNCGTLSFLAPEVFKGTANAGPPLDVWSLGVILFAVLCGRLPFEGPDLRGTRRPRDSVIKSRITKCQFRLDETLSIEAKVCYAMLCSAVLDPLSFFLSLFLSLFLSFFFLLCSGILLAFRASEFDTMKLLPLCANASHSLSIQLVYTHSSIHPSFWLSGFASTPSATRSSRANYHP